MSAADHLAIAAHHAARPPDWPVAPRFDPVDRWYHRIAIADDHEVWLLTWLPGQGTDLHDHGGSSGAFTVVTGTLTEDIATGTPARITSRDLGEGAGHRFGPRYVHRIANRTTRPAVSVHVYGPAITRMNRYHVEDGVLALAGVEMAGVQW